MRTWIGLLAVVGCDGSGGPDLDFRGVVTDAVSDAPVAFARAQLFDRQCVNGDTICLAWDDVAVSVETSTGNDGVFELTSSSETVSFARVLHDDYLQADEPLVGGDDLLHDLDVPLDRYVPGAPAIWEFTAGDPFAVEFETGYLGTEGILVVRSVAALDADPQDEVSYTAGDALGGGVVVLSTRPASALSAGGGSGRFTDADAPDEPSLTYTAFLFTGVPAYSPGSSVTITR